MGNEGTQVLELYGNHVRVRACGICIDNGKILLVGHRLPGHLETFWAPPGGGVHFGETARTTVRREFKEEVGLDVEVGELLLLNEFIEPPLHAIEIFFKIEAFTGSVISGADPEFSEGDQIIDQVRFMDLEEIEKLSVKAKHRILVGIRNLDHFFNQSSFI